VLSPLSLERAEVLGVKEINGDSWRMTLILGYRAERKRRTLKFSGEAVHQIQEVEVLERADRNLGEGRGVAGKKENTRSP